MHVRGGFFGVPEGRFAGEIGAAARREWAVLPRNSGVFGLGVDAERRFSARRTLPGDRGEKIFKKGVKNCEKPEKLGCERCRKVVWEPHLQGVRGDFWSGGSTSGSVAGGAPRVGVSATSTRNEIAEIHSSIYREPVCKLHRSPYVGIPACPTRNYLTFTCGLRLPACRMLITTISSQSRQENPCQKHSILFLKIYTYQLRRK